MVSAGLVLGGVGVASATDEDTTSVTTTGSATTTATTTEATETTPATTTSESTTSESTTSESTTSESTTSESTTSAPTTSSPSTTSPSTSPSPAVSGTAGLGCDGLVTGGIVVTGLEAGVTITVLVEEGSIEENEVVQVVTTAGQTVVPVLGVLSADDVLDVTVVFGGDSVLTAEVPIADVCTGTGTIVLDRDCATPDVVLATVDVSGLVGTEHLVGVVGTSGGRDVVLASDVLTAVGGRIAGVFPLVSADGAVPLDALTGIAVVVDGETLATAFVSDVQLATCVTPLPVAPAVPVAPAPVVQPVASTTHAPATAVHPTAGQLASTGSETGGLLLLAGVFLVLGGLTTMLARRSARS